MIELIQVNKVFGRKKNQKQALKNINLSFPQTGYISIVGESGGGKSTLLNVLAGYEKATSGEILVFGNNIWKMKESELQGYQDSIGIVLQDSVMFPDKTVYENLVYRLNRSKEEIDCNYLERLLNLFKIDKLKNRYPDELSKGEKQRVCMARTLINKPRIILADEPTSALDKENKEILLSVLKEQAKNALVIVVTHSISEEEHIGRVIKIEDGLIVDDILYDEQKTVKEEPFDFKRNNTRKTFLKEILIENNKNIIKTFKSGFFVLLALFSILAFCVNLFSFSDAKNLKQIYKKNDVKHVMCGKQFMVEKDITDLKLNNAAYRVYYLNRFDSTLSFQWSDLNYGVEITNFFLSDMNMTISFGRLPKADDEIALPAFKVAEVLNDYGLDSLDESIQERYWSGSGYKIVGFLETKYEENPRDMIHECAFFNDGYFSNLVVEYDSTHFCFDIGNFQTAGTMNYLKETDNIGMLNDSIVELKDNQIVFPLTPYFFNQFDISLETEEIYDTMHKLIKDFAKDKYQSYFSSAERYEKYIRNCVDNIYHPGYDSSYFRWEAEVQLSLEQLKNCQDENGDLYWTPHISYHFPQKQYQIVGICSKTSIILSNAEYKKFQVYYPYLTGVFVNVNGLKDNFFKAVANERTNYYASSSVSWKMYLGNSIFIYIRYASIPLAMALIVFCGFILLNYIKLSIRERSKRIGLYRLNGISKSELRNTFFISYGLFCLVCGVISIGISSLLMFFMNSLFISMSYEQVMCFSGIGVFITILSILLMCYFANLIFTKKELDKNVVKLLKENND